jgi:hypothetical protein
MLLFDIFVWYFKLTDYWYIKVTKKLPNPVIILLSVMYFHFAYRHISVLFQIIFVCIEINSGVAILLIQQPHNEQSREEDACGEDPVKEITVPDFRKRLKN